MLTTCNDLSAGGPNRGSIAVSPNAHHRTPRAGFKVGLRLKQAAMNNVVPAKAESVRETRSRLTKGDIL